MARKVSGATAPPGGARVEAKTRRRGISDQGALVTALESHTKALHRISDVLEKANFDTLLKKIPPPLDNAGILKVLATFFHRPDLKTGSAFNIISQGAPLSLIANVFNNIKEFNDRGLAIQSNDIDDINTVGELVGRIKVKLDEARGKL
ncbi:MULTISPECIES: hypothetical protein [Mesorhizobium]|uniref:Uncharacterized protein n=3 Tax=Mesorhizobium TaxID=68287 RepID=Q8KGJ2_RHILI|nr:MULTISPECIES: hypothetical protein [Mesorhizobium]MBZ9907546.1 hypothetical protein [Mesorhizobium sp. BR115XR7A]QJF04926.1 hypothetical protein R7A2020_30925 [Mesorhizobium japonicum R7A]QJF10994.1 hypothetical protein HID05_30915 [Mesorhizobium japonicum]QJI86868.1 hypothetical protein HKB46_30925 [Mesorhizobium japonicum]WQB96763.1 hypothetical protein U0R22_000822 [Mesorhizobium huakuii]